MAEIQVTQRRPEEFRVEVTEGESRTIHLVAATQADVERLAAGLSGEALIEETFGFLLERQAKEAIPPTFHVLLIARYHPDYLEEIPRRMEARKRREGNAP